MRAMALILALTLVACDDGTVPPIPTDDTDPGTETDTETGSESESDTDCSPDVDGDGFCPPEDCDDTTIWINPGWAEDPNDNKDNNCDGRIDEVFHRAMVIEYDSAGPSAALVSVDVLGDLKGTYGTSFVARWVSNDNDLKHYVAWDGNAVWRFDAVGTAEKVAEIPEDWEWLNSEDEKDAPYFFMDIAAHPDGYYLVAAADRLLRFNNDGSFSTVAQWACAEEDESHEFCASALAADPITGEVLLLGYFGGVGKWTSEGGMEVLKASDMEAPGPSFSQVQYEVFDTWYGMASYVDEDTGKPAYGMYRWNRKTSEYVLLGTWPDMSWTPNSFAIESETG
ncbi:MAG: hypothetical protein ACI9MC_002664, partial [Kiritimatiellia bacterium]